MPRDTRISWSEIDQEYNGYDEDGKLIVVSANEYETEWNDIVIHLVNNGYSEDTAERAATMFLSQPSEWRGKR